MSEDSQWIESFPRDVENRVRRLLPWVQVPHLVAGEVECCRGLVRLHFVEPVTANVMEAAFQVAGLLAPESIAIEVGTALAKDVRRMMKIARDSQATVVR